MRENGPKNLDDARFEKEMGRVKGISVVDFWAPWCGPCVQMAAGLEAFARSNKDKVKVFKVDVDQNPKTAERYGIRSVPTVIFFRNGEPVHVSRGAMSLPSLQAKLNELLLSLLVEGGDLPQGLDSVP